MHSFAPMNASDILTEDPMTVETDTSLLDAVEILQTLDVRHLPVVSPSGELLGMLSDRDIRNSGIPFTELTEPTEDVPTVADAMNADVITVTPGTTVDEIIDLMLENKIGAVPVIEPAAGDLIGIVSYVDVLRALRGTEG